MSIQILELNKNIQNKKRDSLLFIKKISFNEKRGWNRSG